MMKLITELNDTVSVLAEATEGGSKRWYIEGTWMQSNIKNRNGRVYPKEILEKEVSRYNLQHIKENSAVGELGHPDGPSINQDRVSHKIIELRQSGDDFIGKALILRTPMGKIVEGFLEDNVRIGVSSRGMGSLKENSSGIMEVQSDYYLATAGDIVHDPSAPSAFVNGIMEGTEYFWNNGAIQAERVAEIAVEEIEEAVRSRTLDTATQMKIFEKYINSLIK